MGYGSSDAYVSSRIDRDWKRDVEWYAFQNNTNPSEELYKYMVMEDDFDQSLIRLQETLSHDGTHGEWTHNGGWDGMGAIRYVDMQFHAITIQLP